MTNVLKETQPKLLDKVRRVIRNQGKALGTEKAYCNWIKRYVIFHNKKHPTEMGVAHIKLFISHLAVKEQVSAATQNSALNALCYLYKEVLKIEVDGLEKIKRPCVKGNVAAILSEEEIVLILMNMGGIPQLMLCIIYGSGMTMKECLRLRVKDILLESSQVFIRNAIGKGRKSLLPLNIHPMVLEHLVKVKNLHTKDLKEGNGLVRHPIQEDTAKLVLMKSLQWQWLFPARNITKDPRSNCYLRHHLHQDMLSRHLQVAVAETGIEKLVNIKSFQGAFASHLLQQGYDVRTVQGLLGHSQMDTTLKYDQLLKRVGVDIHSPLEELFKN
jgi:integron integrase